MLFWKKDSALAKEAIAFDEEINQKERDIESNCFRLLLQQHPVARDLRLISTALKMINGYGAYRRPCG